MYRNCSSEYFLNQSVRFINDVVQALPPALQDNLLIAIQREAANVLDAQLGTSLALGRDSWLKFALSAAVSSSTGVLTWDMLGTVMANSMESVTTSLKTDGKLLGQMGYPSVAPSSVPIESSDSGSDSDGGMMIIIIVVVVVVILLLAVVGYFLYSRQAGKTFAVKVSPV
jgi:hypothetical protein